MFKRSLGKKITVLFLMIGLLPLLILSLFFYVQMKYSLRETVENNLITLASQVGMEVERTIFTAYTNIKTLANNPILKSEGATKEDKLLEMQKIQDFYKIFEDITLIDLEGNVITSTTYNYRGAWKIKSWYKQAKEGKVVVSDVHILQSPYKIVMVTTAPVLGRDGRIIAVVAGQINMQKIWEITDRVKLGKTGFVFLVNQGGDIIAYPDKKNIFDKFPSSLVLNRMSESQFGSVNYRSRGGEHICGFVRLKGYMDYKGKHWRAGLIQDSREAFAVIRTTQVTLFSTAFGFFVIIILVSIGLTGDIVRPVRALVAGTQKVAEGDLNYQIKVLSEDEIGELAGAFNLMAKELKKSMEKIENYSRILEQKVEERTRELKDAQVQLIQSAKMGAVGQLSAGVAHEINNPLGGILGYAQFILNKIARPDFNLDDFKRCQDYLKHIERESQRCKQIVESLLTFSRKSTEAFQPVDVKAIMENTLTIPRYSLESQNIKVNIEYAAVLPLVIGNANQLQQVFTNIIINAQHAMPKGGRLDIFLKAVEEGQNKAVQISFQDTGCGIPQENLERIFEPFFTTKQDWKSLGLGLSISYQIIQQHNGKILIESEVGKGSIFTLVLPC
ncbi:MAG: cache domain-containing protein [Candidatus Omnitrophota bacterium]